MSDGRFFLRTNGRILGPLSMVQIESLQHRGRLNSRYEISIDKRTWKPVDDFLSVPASAPAAPHPLTSPAQEDWYYTDNQRQVGPLTLSEIQDLHSSGRLPRHCLVWKDGFPDWLSIDEVPELKPTSARAITSTPQGPHAAPLNRMCLRCGTQDSSGGNFCPQCGNQFGKSPHPNGGDPVLRQGDRKDRLVAALLALLLGGLGIHHFYLGNTLLGIIYLLFCWTFIPAFVALLEAIIFLCSSNASFDAQYNVRT